MKKLFIMLFCIAVLSYSCNTYEEAQEEWERKLYASIDAMEEEVEVITGRVVRVSDTTSQETSGSFVSGAKRHYTYETKSGKKFLLNTGEVVSISCVDDAILFTTHGDSVTVVWKTKGGHRWKGSSFINHDINMSWEQKW